MKTKLLTTLAIVALSITPSFAAIHITFSYNTETGNTTAFYSGSWSSSSSFPSFSTYNELDISPTSFYALNGWFMISGDDFDGQTFAWGTATADSMNGDLLAFDNTYIYAPSGYAGGDYIQGSMTFNDTTLEDLGLTLGDSDSYTSHLGYNTVSFDTAQVPETSTYALGFGLATVGFALARRRARRSR